MSTSTVIELIRDWVISGELIQFVPMDPAVFQVRMVYLAKDVYAYVTRAEIRAGHLRQQLDGFSGGDIITVTKKRQRDRPRIADAANMGLLEPTSKGVWDIRNPGEPSLRIVGAFAAKDHFVGLLLRNRTTLVSETDWNALIEEFWRTWRSYFFVLLPVQGTDNELAYLSNCICLD